MAILRFAGITFGDSTLLDTRFGIIPRNTAMLFYQAAAPTGWTKYTTHNNVALRVVSGVGSATGGVTSFTTAFPSTVISIAGTVSAGGTAGDFTLTTAELPAHTHTGGTGSNTFAAGPATPSRYIERTPIAYGFRSAYRQPVVVRQPVTYRQPIAYRQPAVYRQQTIVRVPQVNRVPSVYRQYFSYRQPQANRTIRNYQQPFAYRQPSTVRAIRNYQQPFSYRRPVNVSVRVPNVTRVIASYRQPVYVAGTPFRVPNVAINRFRNRVPDRVQRRLPRSYIAINRAPQRRGRVPSGSSFINVRYVDRIVGNRQAQRQPLVYNFRTPAVNAPFSYRRPVQFRQAVSFRNPAIAPVRYPVTGTTPIAVRYVQPVRTPVTGITPIAVRYVRNVRVPVSGRVPAITRVPYITRVPSDTRTLVNARIVVNQRVIANQRLAVNQRIEVRYPLVSNVRYITRLLVPGGQIRGANNLAPDTSLEGGGAAHSHPFTGNPAPFTTNIDLRLQYIDVIICSFTG